MSITFVYAQDRKGAIGYNNDLPWRLPNDMKHFKKVTMNHTILMGRKTFESMNKRLLPGRTSVVLTRDESYGKDISGLKTVHNIDDALKLAEVYDIMVIGGAEIYNALLPYADTIERTFIDEEFTADTYINPIDENQFKLVKREKGLKDDKNPYDYYFETWVRVE